jgi:uncharacterized membrane protein YqaE (UPF0057 family)
MKKLSLLLVVAFMSTLILDSCTVQKRYHRKGFNVNWNHTSIGGKKDKNKISYESSEEEIAEVEKTSPSSVTVISNEVKIKEAATPQVVNAYEALENENSIASVNEINTQINTTRSTAFNSTTSSENEVASHKSMNKKEIKKELKKQNKKSSSDVPIVLLYILCFLIPPLAVGLATDWDLTPVLWNLVWCLICGLPGVIHAIIHVSRNR